MKRTLVYLVAVVLFFSFSSMHEVRVPEGKVGSLVPLFSVSNSDTKVSMNELKGKYVLLSFWSSWDAQSRIANIQYNNFAKKAGAKLSLVGINYDRDASMFGAIVEQDKLQSSSQFYDQELDNSYLYEKFNLESGLNSFLVNPAGEIIAQNPTIELLSNILK